MDKFPIEINANGTIHQFDIVDYLHHEGERCKIEVYQTGTLVAALDPDSYEYLHICKNPGNIDKAILHLLIEKLQSHHL